MSEDQTPDPGGTSTVTPTPQELSDLQDQNEVVLIAQLKEMFKNEQSNISQDKVDEYVNTLNRARAKRSKKKSESTSVSSSSSGTTTTTANIDANKKERVNLLRQQLEENKARLAQRGKSQKGIEELVIQLQAQLKDSQTLVSPAQLNISLAEAKHLDYNENTPQKELYNILLTKEKKISDLLTKSEKLEGSILDLQENLKEKDSVIDARTKAVTLMTDSLNKKGKNTLDALEETKDQMRIMQESFVTLEAEMKARQLSLLNDLKLKNFEIGELHKNNSILAKEKSDLERKWLESSPLTATTADHPEIEKMKKEIEYLQIKNKDLFQKMNEAADQAKVDALQKKFGEVTEQNADYLSRISQLEFELKDALVRLEEKKHSTVDFSHEEELLAENRKLCQENADLVSRMNELENTVFKQKESEQEFVENSVVIMRVTKENEILSRRDSENLEKIAELEKQLNDALTELTLMKNTGMAKTIKSDKEDSELSKVKKQLDESNKSMIKMRATQKAKIKELNKKLDQFKKMNDSNVLITQLQNEIVKLNEKIAELEDEKGNLQLKMVDSITSSKDDSTESEEEIKQLKEKLNKTEQEIDEKDKIIEILEAEVISLKSDLQIRSEHEIKVSTQVSSEMSSICYEEQIEMLESGKMKLLEQINALKADKESVFQELELLRKEKQEISAKLDSYIQENIELIDKLEKLSAEKVSSAESIEIVEGLTQQEKLELAAYQKHLNFEEPVKCPEEDPLEPPAELNESVLQLSEDTAELLQKIEMFTQERKEVMQKMECLKEENNSLNIKIKEIENNRDILEETYEQVQNEKEVLQSEKQQLSEQLLQMQKQDGEVKTVETSATVLDTELKELQIKCEILIEENDKLKSTLKDFDSIIKEKYDIEQRLRDVLENNTSLDTKLNSNLEEINTYQLTIEENKTELVSSAGIITKLQKQLEEREQDIQELHMNISELNSVIGELQSKECHFADMESELNNLKFTLISQITQAGDYESEIAQNSETIRDLNGELVGLNRRILELENQLELKDNEIEKLTKDIINKDAIIRSLQGDIEKKDQSFKLVSEDMKAKYLQLKNQLDTNDDSLHRQIADLTNKNKEQLEKMKKIAGNLKKKTQLYQDLEDRYKTEEENWKIEKTGAKNKIESLEGQLASVTQALVVSENNLESNLQQIRSLQNEVQVLRDQLETLEQNNVDQQHYILELKHKQEKIHETSLQQEMTDSLHEDADSSFPKHVRDDKIRELELIMETSESELSDYKEKVDRLHEDLRNHQEANSRLEAINAELAEKLNLTSNSFKEKALLQDQLELRLSEISANEEVLIKKLQEIQAEHEMLVKKNLEHEDLIKRLKIKLKRAHDKVSELKMAQDNLQELEVTNQSLRHQITALEDSQRHIQSENESLRKRNLSDYEKIETDYQLQLEALLKARNDLAIDNEKLLDSVKELAEKEQELTSELSEHKARIEEIEASKSDEIKLLLEDLDAAKLQNAELAHELNDANLKLHESDNQITKLVQERNIAQSQLQNIEPLQTYIQELTMERDEQVAFLKQSKQAHQQVVAELSELKQALQCSENELKLISQQKAELDKQNEQLKQEVLSLEFAKSSLEASCQSSQKPFELPVTEELINPVASFNLSESKTLEDSQKSLLEIEVLRQQLNDANQELQKAVLEIQNLKVQLEEKSIQKSFNDLLQGENEVLTSGETFKNIKQVQIPLFNAFAEGSKGSVFDSFGASGQRKTDWFNVADSPLQNTVNSQVTMDRVENEPVQCKQEPQSFSPVVENNREALLKKIKTLEFLLYNIDKEKEIALDQCTAMVNELTQFIYNKTAPPQADLESQILSQTGVDNLTASKRDLQAAEYTSVHKFFGNQVTPVAEEIVEPKSAYICFDKNQPPKQHDKDVDVLDAQIMSEKDVAEAALNNKELKKLEFERVDPSLGEQRQPVIEPLAQPKHAYLCYTKDDKPHSLEAFEENDDGWGWGPEEARLEEEHINTLENTPQVKSLLLEVQQLKENVRVLQVERENHLEEIRQLQIKSGKLIKKCKELKTKTEQGGTSKKHEEVSFFDLNETIQEELKTQVQQLEKKLKELAVEHEKDKIERNNLLKRVDVLTSANDRMTEMKEIQDAEVFRWQRKYEEIVQKLQEYEWGSDGFGETHKHVANTALPSISASTDQSSKIKELEDTIKDLTLDNEELQSLLEEQNAKRIEAEKMKNTKNERELIELKTMNETLVAELNAAKVRTAELEEEVNRIRSEKRDLEQEKVILEGILSQKEAAIQKLQLFSSKSPGIDLDETEVFNLKTQISADQEDLKTKEVLIKDLQHKLLEVTSEKSELNLTVHQLQQELTTMVDKIHKLLSSLDVEQVQVEKCRSQICNLNDSVHAQESVVHNLSVCVEKLKTEKAALEANRTELAIKLQCSEEELTKVSAENQKIQLDSQTVAQELQSKILESQAVINELQKRIAEMEAFNAQRNQSEEESQDLVAQLHHKTLELEEKHRIFLDLQLQLEEIKRSADNKDEILRDLNDQIKQMETINSEKSNKDAEIIHSLSSELQNKEREFQERMDTYISELNENWKIQVNQRACEVDDSWKRHLAAINQDYIAVQEKMKGDIMELEEKCNILVNENNELRKNVDQEIRNEVDKISALQQQISHLQKTVNLLNEKVVEKDKQIEELQNNIANYLSLENELQILNNENAEKERKLTSIDVIIETTQKQFDEKREVVEDIVSILEKQATSPISYEKEDILRELQRQLQESCGRDGEILKLKDTIRELEVNLDRFAGEKTREITGLNQVIEDLEKELGVIHEKEANIVRLSAELNKVLEEKDKLTHDIGQNQLEKEQLSNELVKLKTEYSQCLTTIEDFRQRIETSANTQQELQHNLDERCKEVHDLNQYILEFQQSASNDNNKELENMYSDLAKMKEEYLVLQNYLSEWRTQLTESNQQLAQKIQELQVANEKIIYYQQSYEDCDQENKRLKELLDQRENEYHNSLEMLKSSLLFDMQGHYEELLSNRDLDINTLKGQIQELITTNQSYAERLNQEMASKEQVQQQLFENTQLVDEDTKQLEELKLIIEDQVAKIEQLKKELFDKSNQYDSLIAEMDVSRPPITRQPLAAVATTPVVGEKRQYEDDDLSAPASRAELDVALYMLHQRDVRCEELTVELTQLLEERDILQLRLSNAIREKEELKLRSPDVSSESFVMENAESNQSDHKFSATSFSGLGQESAKDPLEGEKNLATKLSELKNVGYKKDKTFVDEQDARRMQQLAIMQQHINEVSKLPPEAAAKLVDASYTLSRDVQSPSKVLLNWLWGKNPPKANES